MADSSRRSRLAPLVLATVASQALLVVPAPTIVATGASSQAAEHSSALDLYAELVLR